MSNTRNTPSNNVSNNKIITRYDLTFSDIELQLDKRVIGMIIVVRRTKYMDIPSTPK